MRRGRGVVYVLVRLIRIGAASHQLYVLTGKLRCECSSCNYILAMIPFDDSGRPFRERANVISRQQN